MKVNFCEECGSKLTPGANFCNNCGFKVDSGYLESDRSDNQTKLLMVLRKIESIKAKKF